MDDRTVAAVTLGLGGLLLIEIAWLGARGRLRRNAFVGIRLPSTMRSDAAWLAAHRAGAGATAAAGGVALAGAVVTQLAGTTELRLGVAVTATALAVAAGLVVATRRATGAANAVPR